VRSAAQLNRVTARADVACRCCLAPRAGGIYPRRLFYARGRAQLQRGGARADVAGMDALDQLVDEAVEAHPMPSASAPVLIAEAQAELAGDTPAQPGAHDGAPAGWDPRVHVSPPTSTARGGWKLKPGIRASDVAALIGAPEGAPADTATAANDHAELFFGLCAMALGPEWKPEDAEASEIKRQLQRVYDKHGCIDLPPGAALALAVSMYALPRAMLPSTRERIGAAAARVRALIGASAPTPAQPHVIQERVRDAA
jgi:hypothetical protein